MAEGNMEREEEAREQGENSQEVIAAEIAGDFVNELESASDGIDMLAALRILERDAKKAGSERIPSPEDGETYPVSDTVHYGELLAKALEQGTTWSESQISYGDVGIYPAFIKRARTIAEAK